MWKIRDDTVNFDINGVYCKCLLVMFVPRQWFKTCFLQNFLSLMMHIFIFFCCNYVRFFTVGHSTLFSLLLHHGGQFTRFPGREYINGKNSNIDTDEFSLPELDSIMLQLGYNDCIGKY